jgi:hypothetical protein
LSVAVASVRLDVGLENIITSVDNAENYCSYKSVCTSAGTGMVVVVQKQEAAAELAVAS